MSWKNWLVNPTCNGSVSKKCVFVGKCSYCFQDIDIFNMERKAIRKVET